MFASKTMIEETKKGASDGKKKKLSNEIKKQTAGSVLHQHQDKKVQESLKLTCKEESPRSLRSRR
jgi:hypothetical protein